MTMRVNEDAFFAPHLHGKHETSANEDRLISVIEKLHWRQIRATRFPEMDEPSLPSPGVLVLDGDVGTYVRLRQVPDTPLQAAYQEIRRK